MSATQTPSPLPAIDPVNMPAEAFGKAELAQAIVSIGHLLPYGLSVTFYRPGEAKGDMRVAVQTTYQDGDVTTHWFTDVVAH